MEKIAEKNQLPTGQGVQYDVQHGDIFPGGSLGNGLAETSVSGGLAEVRVCDE
ncbi:hypothetical protein D3C86_1974100 [compost metagenome]